MITTAGCFWDMYTQVLQLRSRGSRAAISYIRAALCSPALISAPMLCFLLSYVARNYFRFLNPVCLIHIAPCLAHFTSVPLQVVLPVMPLFLHKDVQLLPVTLWVTFTAVQHTQMLMHIKWVHALQSSISYMSKGNLHNIRWVYGSYPFRTVQSTVGGEGADISEFGAAALSCSLFCLEQYKMSS